MLASPTPSVSCPSACPEWTADLPAIRDAFCIALPLRSRPLQHLERQLCRIGVADRHGGLPVPSVLLGGVWYTQAANSGTAGMVTVEDGAPGGLAQLSFFRIAAHRRDHTYIKYMAQTRVRSMWPSPFRAGHPRAASAVGLAEGRGCRGAAARRGPCAGARRRNAHDRRRTTRRATTDTASQYRPLTSHDRRSTPDER